MRASLVSAAVAAAFAVAPARAEVAETRTAPWLGISLRGGPGEYPMVVDVHPDTAAAAVGLQPDDVITNFDDISLGHGFELSQLVMAREVGDRVRIRFLRAERSHTVSTRLTAKPPIDEIVHRRLIDHVAPPVTPFDGQGLPIPATERGRRAQVWVVFDVHCDRCAGDAAALEARLGEAGDDGRPVIPVRVLLVGEPDEAKAYRARIPVLGTVWRVDRSMEEEDPRGFMIREVPVGSRYLSGLDVRNEGVIVVLDAQGVVRFATALSLGEVAHDGACAAASRFARTWRR